MIEVIKKHGIVRLWKPAPPYYDISSRMKFFSRTTLQLEVVRAPWEIGISSHFPTNGRDESSMGIDDFLC